MTNPKDPRVEAAARALRIEQCLNVQMSHTYAKIALKAADEEAWQTIESAPRDGTRILIRKTTGYICTAIFDEGEWYGDDWYCVHPEQYITHWQPLPTPPENP